VGYLKREGEIRISIRKVPHLIPPRGICMLRR
jgi:hypothetical protein